MQRPVSWIRSLDKLAAEYPLIMNVIIASDDIEIIRMPTELRPQTSCDHIESVKLRSRVSRRRPVVAVRIASGSVTTLISGSTCTKRACGTTSRIASIAAMVARTNWHFNSSPRPVSNGCRNALIASSPCEERRSRSSGRNTESLGFVENKLAKVLQKREKRLTNQAEKHRDRPASRSGKNPR